MSDKYSGAAFRRSIVYFTAGRILNALAGFGVFLWIAHHLPVEQYANYVAAFALLEIGLVLSSFGMEWVSAVYIPQAKLRATGRVLERFVWNCAAVQAGMLFVGSCFFYLLAPRLAAWLALEGAGGAFRAYALVMFVEGVSRVLRDQLLSNLLLQGAAQTSQLARHATMITIALWMFQSGKPSTAENLAIAEFAASTCSLFLAAILLYRSLILERADASLTPEWHLPPWAEMLKAARNAWLSNLANLSWGGQIVILLATRLMGAETTAALGFARNLSEQVRKYMPMEFLYGPMRTLLIARFAAEADCRKLGIRAGLMFKGNLLFLLPILVVAIERGDQVCSLLSGGRYDNARWLLVGWLSVLIAWAHRRPTDVLAHALGRSGATSRGSFILLGILPALLVVVRLQEWSVLFLVLLAAETAYSGIVLAQIDSAHGVYQPDFGRWARFGVAALIAGVALSALGLGSGIMSLLLTTGLAFVGVWTGVFLLRGWSSDEIALLPEKLFRRVVPIRGAQ